MKNSSNTLKIDGFSVENSEIGVQISKTNAHKDVLVQNGVISNCRVGIQVGQPISDVELIIESLCSRNLIPAPLTISEIQDLVNSVISSGNAQNAQTIINGSSLKDKVSDVTVWLGFAGALLDIAAPFIS